MRRDTDGAADLGASQMHRWRWEIVPTQHNCGAYWRGELQALLERCRTCSSRQNARHTPVTETGTDTQSQPDEAALEEARLLLALRAADEEDDQAPDEYAEAHEHFETHTTQEHVEWLTEMHKKGRLLAVPLLAAPPSPVKTARPKAAAKRKTTRTTKGCK